ncbi:MAG: hypothetical protein SOR61_09190 [Evtepia sp.]|uniref:hypothetical protein n=1 Tax=Evtepia sp. TaxID=2773933 RepID=UPI002A756FEE|nr:hypothetical protein [Evtepia sp.]MDY3015326.1 hypothetical protein [Evtepia sp.]
MYNRLSIILPVSIVLSVIFTLFLLLRVLPETYNGKRNHIFQFFYDIFTPQTLTIERLLQVLYIFLTCTSILCGLFQIFSWVGTSFGYYLRELIGGLVLVVVVPILLRLIHELLLLALLQLRATRDISAKLDQLLANQAVQTPGSEQGTSPSPSSPLPEGSVPDRRCCPYCGTLYRGQADTPCPGCGKTAP